MRHHPCAHGAVRSLQLGESCLHADDRALGERPAGGAHLDPLKDISPVAIRTVVASEDSAFCTHWGIDIAEIRRMMQRADSLSDMRGTSTISMQVVKNLFLWQKPEIPRKLLEIPLTFWLDLVMSKERILEIYLNIAEWGPEGQFGIAAGRKRHSPCLPKG